MASNRSSGTALAASEEELEDMLSSEIEAEKAGKGKKRVKERRVERKDKTIRLICT